MTDEEWKKILADKYQDLCHAVLSGTLWEMSLEMPGVDINADAHLRAHKHLLHGNNLRAVDQAALVTLLIKKGVFTELEYFLEINEAMKREVARMEQDLEEKLGNKVTLV